MAGWREGVRICRHLFLSPGFVQVALIFIASFMSVPMTSYAQEGFLSIDCGYTGANYSDHGLTWTADYGTYIKVGDTFEQSALNSNDVGSQSLRSYRYFPVHRNKYCYELPTPGITYLIRVTFYMNESVLKEKRPFQFILSLDATDWFTLTSGDDSLSRFNVIQEAIIHPQPYVTNVCLQPVIGVPFISSLELRQIDDDMYNYSRSDVQYLALLFRYSLGTTSSVPLVRFPDDVFDRIWETETWTNEVTNISNSTPPDNTSDSRADVYYVPPKVMQDGWLLNTTSDISYLKAPIFTLYSRYLPVYMTSAEFVFPVIYAEHLNNTDSKVYTMNVTMDSVDYQDVNFSNQASMKTIPNFGLSSNTIQIGLGSLLRLHDGPTINAVEVYGQYNYNSSVTDPLNVDAITALKNSLNLTDWQGDPCTPVPHDWLSCSIYPVTNTLDYPDYQPVVEPCGLNGTSSVFNYCAEEQGSQVLYAQFSVTTLNMDRLTNEGLSLFTIASANTSNIWLSNLAEMSITNSGIESETLQLLLNNFLWWLTDLLTLDLSYNAIVDIPKDWYAVYNLTSLNMSHNQISGVMSSFEYAPLQKLDLSYNNLTSLPTIWNNTVSSLVFLDLSHNQLRGSISSLDQLVGRNNGSLRELHISNNNLGGSFSSSLYFSGIPNLTVGNFDQNNFQGTLDLSRWYKALQKATSGNSSTNIVTRQKFSFVNNSISDISPNAETIKSAVDLVMGNNPSLPPFGILLGGNPYCNRAKSNAQQYLCRHSLDHVIPNHHKSKTYILIISICGGIVALLLSSFTTATLWKLWKQVYALRAIQQALADRKVQPPFYQYNDLELATREFHRDNKLGHGGFGVVYKGVLVDKTSIAVKKLFNSKRLKVLDDLNEFLNEVVLITGIKHRNLVQLKGCCIKDKQRMLVYEYVEKGNLAEALWGPTPHGGLNWEQRFKICVGVARGLSYLHEELQPSIIHRDIKPENILLDKDFKPKIADFGMARQCSNEENQAQYTINISGTLGYFSPEYASQGQLSDKADVYSYGIVVLEVISGRKCIDHSLPSEEVYLKDWVRKMHSDKMLIDVLQQELRDNCVVADVIRAIKIGLLCVQNSPGSRPSMSQVVTMLLGSTDIDVILDESDNSHHDNSHRDFKDLMDSINEDLELESVVEEGSVDLFFLDQNFQRSSSSINSRSSSTPLIELSSIQGR